MVPKKNCNSVRRCSDFKQTVNKAMDSSYCVLPIPTNNFSSLSNSKYFTTLDL